MSTGQAGSDEPPAGNPLRLYRQLEHAERLIQPALCLEEVGQPAVGLDQEPVRHDREQLGRELAELDRTAAVASIGSELGDEQVATAG